MLDKEKLKLLLHATKDKAVIVVDEAYIEFCPQFSQIDLVNQCANIAIIRTPTSDVCALMANIP
jgi:histidinol-phosphate aminotransferase